MLANHSKQFLTRYYIGINRENRNTKTQKTKPELKPNERLVVKPERQKYTQQGKKKKKKICHKIVAS